MEPHTADMNTIDIPENHGLWIRLLNDTGAVRLQPEPGAPYPHIHPNCNAPASLRDVRMLYGGGSGTAVFSGVHAPTGMPLVLKHGGPSDTLEVFALAQISDQLQKRGGSSSDDGGDGGEQRQAAAQYMRSRIPEFVGVFVSPFHFRDRGQEMWSTVRDASALLTDSCLKLLEGPDYDDDDTGSSSSSSEEEGEEELQQMSQSQRSASSRSIRICQQEQGQQADMQVLLRTVMLYIPVCGEDGSIVEGGI